jgi:hypothetical protein
MPINLVIVLWFSLCGHEYRRQNDSMLHKDIVVEYKLSEGKVYNYRIFSDNFEFIMCNAKVSDIDYNLQYSRYFTHFVFLSKSVKKCNNKIQSYINYEGMKKLSEEKILA